MAESAAQQKENVRVQISQLSDQIENKKKDMENQISLFRVDFDKRKAKADRNDFYGVINALSAIITNLNSMNQWREKYHEDEFTDLETSEDFRVKAHRSFELVIKSMRSMEGDPVNGGDPEEDRISHVEQIFRDIHVVNLKKIECLKKLKALDKDIRVNGGDLLEAVKGINKAEIEAITLLLTEIKALQEKASKKDEPGLPEIAGDIISLIPGLEAIEKVQKILRKIGKRS